ncbi:MAG: Oxidoreductase molybdopterin binding domain protein [Pelotomaculum sp. PtaB.Bin013]|uniref:Molybdopterin-dependent oxidoreductase n=1 Tax=Pelotomaculum isophthalicicum JI TaxID=947010 RepID=A0A9X4H6N1_9FIRM|nr:molybdopterin-dependent oxidoreductase [Pelotomaculum isophthalicicum]MDF9409023.1 molybdopterin-dependent oxidoreductase [Pelotomaculum isophthalicicum JI]OPX91358.1 MAG: Oxidoreductase molybdopterin binding domain protein [Pelotomaculum sp. PtaB.Bin013]
MTETGKELNPKKLLGLGILLLAFIIAVFAFLNRDREGLREGQLLIKAEGVRLGVLTVDDLRKLPEVRKRMVINSTSGLTRHEFTGTPLAAVLDSVDHGLTQKYARIVTRGIDNYTSGVSMSEILRPDNVYVVYSDYGKPLKTKTGGEGTIQIVVCDDEFGQRFTNYLVSLELQ